jgi:hypothetical protein
MSNGPLPEPMPEWYLDPATGLFDQAAYINDVIKWSNDTGQQPTGGGRNPQGVVNPFGEVPAPQPQQPIYGNQPVGNPVPMVADTPAAAAPVPEDSQEWKDPRGPRVIPTRRPTNTPTPDMPSFNPGDDYTADGNWLSNNDDTELPVWAQGEARNWSEQANRDFLAAWNTGDEATWQEIRNSERERLSGSTGTSEATAPETDEDDDESVVPSERPSKDYTRSPERRIMFDSSEGILPQYRPTKNKDGERKGGLDLLGGTAGTQAPGFGGSTRSTQPVSANSGAFADIPRERPTAKGFQQTDPTNPRTDDLLRAPRPTRRPYARKTR